MWIGIHCQGMPDIIQVEVKGKYNKLYKSSEKFQNKSNVNFESHFTLTFEYTESTNIVL